MINVIQELLVTTQDIRITSVGGEYNIYMKEALINKRNKKGN